jgi:hypothetical protein
MYKCLSHVFRENKIPFYVHYNTLTLGFQEGKTKWMNVSTQIECLIISYNKLRLILNFLCFVAHKFTLQRMVSQQPGTILENIKSITQSVSTW